MINLQLTVREAMNLATSWAYNNDAELYHKIVNSFEIALGVNQNRTVTITGGMTLDNRIYCIKAIRLHTGWGLKESKEWSDYLVGGWKYDKFVPAAAGAKNSVTLDTPEAAENLLRDLVDKGCEGFLS
jgi:ribosomal protein L7/L12